MAGARRSIYDPRGNRLTFYAWGLGNISNNLTKAYSLWMVLCITKEEGFKKKMVLGDSMMIMLACLQAGVLVIDGKIRVCSDGKIGTM